MAKTKFYVVWKGRKPGIFTHWASCKQSVDGFAGARYKSFPTRQEAEQAYAGGNPGRAAYRAAGAGAESTAKKPTAAARSRKAASTAAPAGDFQLQIYCDGGCDPNPGRAGSGVAIYRDGALSELWYGLYNPCGTNNTAELNALYQSLLRAEQGIRNGLSVQILADSTYAINCISKWAEGWEARGWTRPTGEIKNLDIIKPAYALYQRISKDLVLSHVKAHAGTEGNELADRMSILAVDREEVEFVRLPEPLDVDALLRLRAG